MPFAPDSVSPLRVRAPVPVFFTVMAWAAEVVFTFWPAKDMLTGVTVSDGLVAEMPVPLSARLWEGLEALSVIVTVPVWAPMIVGRNWTWIAQL